jgi:signal transduction histidine kinase
VDEAVRLEKITNDLLDFARTAALHRSPADPVALARAVAVDTDPARVRVDADRAPGAWSLDADKLRQVLLNVVQNALAIDKAGGPVEVAVTVSDRELRLTVRDHGPGLPAGEVEQLFQPFFTTRTKGTGLGLPVSRRIARLHGGDLLAANHPDGGAVFTITIPEDPHGATAGRR